MIQIRNVTLIGGGSQTHSIAGILAKNGYQVTIMTRRPSDWAKIIVVNAPDKIISGTLHNVTDNPREAVKDADVILLTVPGTANESELKAIKPYIRNECYVGGVFCSSGFFFKAMEILPPDTKLWGFQRVPYIARVEKYGHSVNLTGYRPLLHIAVERVSQKEKEDFRAWIEKVLGSETKLLYDYLAASITNSNPILHTSRLYTMFHNWSPEQRSDKNILFYADWTIEAAQLLIAMDDELSLIINHLLKDTGLTREEYGFAMPLLPYYESYDAMSLQKKLTSIKALSTIESPMKLVDGGWIPDYSNRYFTEDFGYSLGYIWKLGKKFGIETPNIDKVYRWGCDVIHIPLQS